MHILDMAGAVIKIALGIVLFTVLFYSWLVLVRDWEETGRSEREVGTAYSAPTEETAPVEDEETEKRLYQIYMEGDGPAPEWYDPDGPMAAEWSADETICGWDGHTMTPDEMELFARITYKEFWGTSSLCCEAGVDSILRLWESEYYGKTIYETLSAKTEGGAWAYSTYPYVWATEYDAEGLAYCRALCEERFAEGPIFEAPFFQLSGYPWWSVPCYEIDGVYFSTFKEGTR